MGRMAWKTMLGSLIASLSLSAAVWAGDMINAQPGEVAVQGYDVVAYFTQGAPTKGDPDIEFVWQDVRWRFTSEEHRASFAENPGKFAPRYGGYCAGGMLLGATPPIDPEAFVVLDGKLYLAFDRETAADFSANAAENIQQADEQWKALNEDN